jgi:[CysO sulfur-carrier protein]-S-L-cysteine hydrolase
MRIARAMHDEMVAQALEDAPNECCGMISARDGELVTLYRMRNAAASPFRYELDPREQYEIEYGQIYDAGLDVGVIYHSHTRSAPYPSQTDINLANHPGAVYVIVGVKDRDAPEVRAYSIRDEVVEEVPITGE